MLQGRIDLIAKHYFITNQMWTSQTAVLACVYVLGGCQLALSHQSKLRVAVCNPGMVPFVMIGAEGNFEGYDIGINIAVYNLTYGA